MKPVQPDAALGAIVGTDPLPRTDITSKLWEYIKKNGSKEENQYQRRRKDEGAF